MSEKSQKKNLDPAFKIILKIGGFRPTARMLGISPSAVLRWTLPTDVQGSGGKIPQKHWQPIINYAKLNKISISLTDLSNVR